VQLMDQHETSISYGTIRLYVQNRTRPAPHSRIPGATDQPDPLPSNLVAPGQDTVPD
jgi:hypothetical protein